MEGNVNNSRAHAQFAAHVYAFAARFQIYNPSELAPSRPPLISG